MFVICVLVLCTSDVVWQGGSGMLVVSMEMCPLEGQENKAVPREAFGARGAQGLINERLKLLFFGLCVYFLICSIACLSPAVFRLEKLSAFLWFLLFSLQ